MSVEMLTRQEAVAEREQVLRTVHKLVGTTDRDDLRDLDMQGALSSDALTATERLRTLDFLLAG